MKMTAKHKRCARIANSGKLHNLREIQARRIIARKKHVKIQLQLNLHVEAELKINKSKKITEQISYNRNTAPKN